MRIHRATGIRCLCAALAIASSTIAQSKPDSVLALRYQCCVSESFTDFNHGGGYWIDEIWFPEKGVVANVTFKMRFVDEKWVDEPTLNAFFSDIRNSSPPRPLEDEIELPTEEVRVPLALANRIFDVAETNRRLEEERK